MIFADFLKKPFGLGVLFLSLPAWLRCAPRFFPLTIMNLCLSSAPGTSSEPEWVKLPGLDLSVESYRVVRLCGCEYLDVSPSEHWQIMLMIQGVPGRSRKPALFNVNI